MTSRNKRSTNRRNASHSTGPVSDAGKAVVAMNRTTHGLWSTANLIPGEAIEEWNAFCAGVVAAFAPVGAPERETAERVAALYWRLRRVERYETAAVSGGLVAERDETESAPLVRIAPYLERERLLNGVSRCSALVAGFRRLQAAADDAVFDARLAHELVLAAHGFTAWSAHEPLGGEFFRDTGVPVHYYSRPDYWLGWTAAVLRKGLAWIARTNDLASEVLLEECLAKTQANLEEFSAQLARRKRKRRRRKKKSRAFPISKARRSTRSCATRLI